MRNERDRANAARIETARRRDLASNLRVASLGILALAASGGIATTAFARPVTFPKTDPKVVMEVPDDFAVAYTAFGLEITASDKKLYIVADIVPRDKARAESWARAAAGKMQAFGVTFEKSGAATKTAQASVPSAPKPGSAADETTAAAPRPDHAKAPVDRSAPTFTFMDPGEAGAMAAPPTADPVPVFSGSPSLATPGKPDVQLAVRTDVPAGEDFAEMSLPVAGSGPRLPYKVGHYSGTKLEGVPIDVEFVDFGLSPQQLLLVLQASLSSDDRAADILKSIKPSS